MSSLKENSGPKRSFPLLLLFSAAAGGAAGFVFKEKTAALKPAGDIFLNLLFTVAVPLVFFSISSAVAEMKDNRKLGRIAALMLLVFAATGLIAAALMLVGVVFYPPRVEARQVFEAMKPMSVAAGKLNAAEMFTVSDFSLLFSKKNMLALIVFAVLVGLATGRAGERGRSFREFLKAANDVMLEAISLIMLYAPVGLFAYFAYLSGVLGPQLLGAYLRAAALYYPISFFYFFFGFSLYAWLAGGREGARRFWRSIPATALTAFGTGSSLAALPANLQASDKAGIPREVSGLVIPLGATLHMDGSCLSAVLKIALLFNLYGLNLFEPLRLASVPFVALLSGVVMSGITGGGFLGEVLIVSVYGFPPEALPIISMLGMLVDPPATMVNSTGDNVASMLVSRMLYGRGWLQIKEGRAEG